ncbi:MAG: hypothetical protein ACLP4V_05955 [Methylocella sp.]
MRLQVMILAAALVVALAASPALAMGRCLDCGRAAPSPMAGAGLGFLVLAGGYYVVRRWRKRNTEE